MAPKGFEFMSTAGSLQHLPAASVPVTLTPSGTTWANSSYGQIIASAASDLVLMAVLVQNASLFDVDYEFDVATGGAGSEIVIATISGSEFFGSNDSNGRLTFPLPIDNIASGSRIAIRMRHRGTNTSTFDVSIEVASKPLGGNQSTTTNPSLVMPSAADGTLVVFPSGAWTNSSWTQVTASTAAAIILGGMSLGNSDGNGTNLSAEIDIGTGGAGSEVVITTFRFRMSSNGGSPWQQILTPLLDNIAASTRIAVRARNTGSIGNPNQDVKLLYYNKAGIGSVSNVLGTKPLKWAPSAAEPLNLAWGGSNWSNGAYQEFINSTAAAIQIIAIVNGGTTGDRELDIATGGSGSETPVTTLRFCSGGGNGGGDQTAVLSCPFNNIATATRVAARIRSSSNTSTADIAIGYYEALDATLVTAFPTASLPSAANQISITPSGTAFNNSSWVQLTSGILVTTAISWLNYLAGVAINVVEIDIGIGGAGSEVVQQTVSASLLSFNGMQYLRVALPLIIPVSTRIAFRMRKAGTDTSAWTFGATYFADVKIPGSGGNGAGRGGGGGKKNGGGAATLIQPGGPYVLFIGNPGTDGIIGA